MKHRLRADTHILENQFGFTLGRSTMEAIYLLWRERELTWKKIYDMVSRDILWKALEKKKGLYCIYSSYQGYI